MSILRINQKRGAKGPRPSLGLLALSEFWGSWYTKTMIINQTLCVLLAVMGSNRNAQAGSVTPHEAPVLAMVGFPSPTLDANHLNWMFDRAMMGIKQVATPPNSKHQTNVSVVKHEDIVGLPKEYPIEVPIPASTRIYRHAFMGFASHPELTDRYDPQIIKYAAIYHLDPRLIKAVIAAESAFHENARSPKGARGLMQIVPRTASYFGVSSSRLYFGDDNISAGSAYLASLFGNILKKLGLSGASLENVPSWVIERVIAAYHAGPRFLRNRKLYRSTREYVKKVMTFYHSPVSQIRNAQQTSPLTELLTQL